MQRNSALIITQTRYRLAELFEWQTQPT